MVTPAVLQLPGGRRAGHQPWQKGELEGLKPGWHPTWLSSQPHYKQQLCRDLWEVEPGLLPFQRTSLCRCWLGCQRGLLLSAELTSKLTSNPLLFPGSFPISQLSISELAAQPLLTRFLVTKNTPSHHEAFPRHFSSIFQQRSAYRVCVPLSSLGKAFACPTQGLAPAGRSWHLALSLPASAAIPAGCPKS